MSEQVELKLKQEEEDKLVKNVIIKVTKASANQSFISGKSTSSKQKRNEPVEKKETRIIKQEEKRAQWKKSVKNSPRNSEESKQSQSGSAQKKNKQKHPLEDSLL